MVLAEVWRERRPRAQALPISSPGRGRIVEWCASPEGSPGSPHPVEVSGGIVARVEGEEGVLPVHVGSGGWLTIRRAVGAEVEQGEVIGVLEIEADEVRWPARTSPLRVWRSRVDILQLLLVANLGWLLLVGLQQGILLESIWKVLIVGALVGMRLLPSTFYSAVPRRFLMQVRKNRPPALDAAAKPSPRWLEARHDASTEDGLRRLILPLDVEALRRLAASTGEQLDDGDLALLARHPDDGVALGAAARRARRGDTSSLWDVLRRPDPGVRATALAVLGEVGTATDLERLVITLRSVELPPPTRLEDGWRAERALGRRHPGRIAEAAARADAIVEHNALVVAALRQARRVGEDVRSWLPHDVEPEREHLDRVELDGGEDLRRIGLDVLGSIVAGTALGATVGVMLGQPAVGSIIGFLAGLTAAPFVMFAAPAKGVVRWLRDREDRQALLESGRVERAPGQLGLPPSSGSEGALAVPPPADH